ncbi:MAG: AAA family ATPase, partial [Planctomycetales bacterium]
MNIPYPIYVERTSNGASEAPDYEVRPLFASQPVFRGADLDRTISKLSRELRKDLRELSREKLHDQLARQTFCPDLEERRLSFRIELKQGNIACKFLIVVFRELDRRIAFTPRLPDLWFEILRGENPRDRARDALTDYFRERERDDPDEARSELEHVRLGGKAWTTVLDLEFSTDQKIRASRGRMMASMSGEGEFHGGAELNRVGRCLDWMFPEELERVALREKEIGELTEALTSPDRRPVLIVGRPLVGKTSLVHECTYRRVAERRNPHASNQNVWLLSPQRLISGMCYVGQWENRLLAILKEAEKRDHVLYFDHLLGLFQAGVSRDSNLNVAQVMKPYIERRQVRVLGEITPEALRVFRETDRGLADLFQILPLEETSDRDALRIMLRVVRQMEWSQRCEFELDVPATVMELQRRYVREAAFPGKGARFLRQLATKHRRGTVGRADVLQEFRDQSGLSLDFLDDQASLEHEDVVTGLSAKVVGQADALRASADAVCLAKARLNDPTRPLASFLFLGPTGVGKTQAAKALAAYLFGDEDRMIRFDMNEYVSVDSVARLVGTFHDPEGLLTSAVRRRPFCVLLLDEIEKSHPDALDLLLQVLGEGRLTDALGRTADFTNAIIVMTSNLGSREAASGLGFAATDDDRDSVYEQAARRFFRPEFFNRIDRILPFRPLSREEIADIATMLMQDVLAREGLSRRKCFLQVEDAAMERVVDQGYHPRLGARALKRAIERQLTQPVAAQLATFLPETPTIVSLFGINGSIVVRTQELSDVEPLAKQPGDKFSTAEPGPGRLLAELKKIRRAVYRIENELSDLRPTGAVVPDEVTSGE